MPWLDTTTPMSPGAQAWQTAIKHSLQRRYQSAQVAGPFRALAKLHHVAAKDIADVLIGFRAPDGHTDPPLLFKYAEILLKEKLIGVDDLLDALLNRSRYGSNSLMLSGVGQIMPSCEERMFNMISEVLTISGLPSSVWTSPWLIRSLTQWLHATTEYEMSKQLEGGGLHTLDPITYRLYEALVTLAITILNSPSLRNLTHQAWWKKQRAIVVTKMEEFDTHILQWMQSDFAGRLRMLAGIPPYLACDEAGRPIFTERQALEMIQDVPVVNSRAGLYIWLDALLCARPLTDDMNILAYLHGRYGGDSQSMVVDLLVASFDVLTNALLRNDSKQNVKIIRSFICNKLPIVLSMLSGMIVSPMTIEAFVQVAFISDGMISMEPLAPLTAGATEMRDSLKATRLGLLQACALHGLVTESCITSIVRDPAFTLPRVTKYTKEGLIAQCANNTGRLEALVDELKGMQGNAGAIAGCIADTIVTLCIAKDTMSLKSVCTELIKKMPLLDVIMQYTQPRMILMPLCTLLNDWVHDQDQTEFAPAYEEFAIILLFILATIHRYDLAQAEIGLIADTFVAQLLGTMKVSKPPGELAEEQATQLAKWIEGLYTVDDHGETSGIGDDVMRQCSPQSFYMLVPSLFEQSVFACRMNALPMKTFKGGLELLLEPFLLPSLVMGLGWLAEHSWEDHIDSEILLGVLDKLLKPSSSSQETQAMHRAILAIVATPLSNFLQRLECKKAEKKHKTQELLEILKPHLNQQRNLHCSKSEMEEWMPNTGDRESHLHELIRQLVSWASTPSQPPNPPPKYTYRQFVLACQVLNCDTLVQALLTQVKQDTLSTSIALDVVAALVCAPTSDSLTVESASRAANMISRVREYIRVQVSNSESLLENHHSDAEALVRLSKRIETQLSVPAVAMPIQIQEQETEQIIQDLGLGDLAEDVAVTGADQTSQLAGLDPSMDLSDSAAQELANIAVDSSAMQLDQSQIFDGLGIDMNQVPQGDQQVDALHNTEEDIFAGLDMDLGDDFFV